MAEINVTDLTTGTVDGTGIFDALMQVTKAHIQEEYDKNRIKGPEYATVYLGAMQAVMDRALQFLLQQQRVDLEAQLLAEQIETEGLQQLKLIQETTNLATENTVLVAQECKLRAEYDLIMEQKLKTTQETALLAQKKVTEQAQTNGSGVDADSVIGKQKLLYAAQTAGYQRNAEQKAADLLISAWNVRRTTDTNNTAANTTNQLDDGSIGQVIGALKAGVGV